jgi:hypothetical protein
MSNTHNDAEQITDNTLTPILPAECAVHQPPVSSVVPPVPSFSHLHIRLPRQSYPVHEGHGQPTARQM